MDNNLFESVRERLATYLRVPIESIDANTDIRTDLRADSITLTGMLFDLEDEFGITISNDVLPKISRVDALVEYLSAQLDATKTKRRK